MVGRAGGEPRAADEPTALSPKGLSMTLAGTHDGKLPAQHSDARAPDAVADSKARPARRGVAGPRGLPAGRRAPHVRPQVDGEGKRGGGHDSQGGPGCEPALQDALHLRHEHVPAVADAAVTENQVCGGQVW